MLGGYKIIDLKGLNITTVPTHLVGIYERIESSRSAKLLCNIQIDGKEYDDTFVCFVVVGSDLKCAIPDGTGTGAILIKIDQDDMITKEVA